MSLPRTLFVGKSRSAVCWYRCALPAMALGQEWVGVEGAPPDVKAATGLLRRPFEPDHLYDYDVVVLQQPERPWRDLIHRLRTRGIAVLFEIDDYVQAVRKMASHEGRRHWSKERVEGLEANMRAVDGLICSTEFLARRYAAFNERVWVCRNGLDLRRYDYAPPPRDGVTIGWAGGVGHTDSLRPWLPEVAQAMRTRPQARFMTVGQPFGHLLAEEFGPERGISVPFGHLETYPASMTPFDLAIAPAGRNNLFRGKSDLRWLEASALGIPLIADPLVYPEVEPGVTGFHATTAAELRPLLAALLDDAELRARVGEAARAYVCEHRAMEVAARRWAEAITEVASGAVAA